MPDPRQGSLFGIRYQASHERSSHTRFDSIAASRRDRPWLCCGGSMSSLIGDPVRGFAMSLFGGDGSPLGGISPRLELSITSSHLARSRNSKDLFPGCPTEDRFPARPDRGMKRNVSARETQCFRTRDCTAVSYVCLSSGSLAKGEEARFGSTTPRARIPVLAWNRTKDRISRKRLGIASLAPIDGEWNHAGVG